MNSPVERPRGRLLQKIGPNWGLFVLVIATIVGFINVARPRNQLHYIIFSGGADNLWHGLTPYGNDFGTNLGYYIYSPSCGLFFYGLFSWMPFGLGLFLYMAVSIPIFLYGVKSFLAAYVPSFSEQFSSRRGLQWLPIGNFQLSDRRAFNFFWLAASYCVLGCLTADKLELIIVGVTLFNLSLMVRNKHIWLAAFLWAMMTNWKLQPLPLVGLISIVLLILDWKRCAKFVSAFVVSLAFWYAAPIPVLGFDKLKDFSLQWSSTLTEFIATHWFDYQHVMKLPIALGLNPSLRMLNLAGAVGGIVFAAVTLVFVVRLKREANSDAFTSGTGAIEAAAKPTSDSETTKHTKLSRDPGTSLLVPSPRGTAAPSVNFQVKLGLFVATVWGQWYAVGFSPMSQSNAFILALPIFLIGTLLLVSNPDRDGFTLSASNKQWLKRGLIVAGFVGYLMTSDIFGKTIRQFVSNAGVCAYAFLIGAIAVTWACFKIYATPTKPASAMAD